jgi:hypothetical protein
LGRFTLGPAQQETSHKKKKITGRNSKLAQITKGKNLLTLYFLSINKFANDSDLV